MVFTTTFLGLLLSFCFYKYCQYKQKESEKKIDVINQIRNSKEIIVVLIVVAGTRLLQLGTTPRWDSEYYLEAIINACKNFDFTISSFMQSFKLCGHTTYGYSLFLAIGEYLNPNDVYGINSVNLVLVLIFSYFIYEIIKYIFPDLSKLSIAMGTLLVLSEPLALGTFGNINIDFPIMIFSIFLVFMHIRKYYILLFFFSVVLIQSKEVGIVVALGYGVSYLLLLLGDNIKNRRKETRKICFVGLLCIILLCYLFAVKNGEIDSWTSGVQFGVTAENQSNYFAFVPDYIILKLKMIFLMNFYWLFSAIIVVGSFLLIRKVYCKRLGRGVALEKAYPLIALGGGLTALFLFNCLYVTWSNPRYHYALQTGLFLLLVFIILLLVENRRVQQSIFLCLTIICLCQSYTTVDFVTTSIFERQETGAVAPIVHPAWNARENRYNQQSILKDMAVYNNQLGFMDKAYNEILENIEYNEELDIIIWDKIPNYNAFSSSSINAHWNVLNKKRTFAENESTVKISIVSPINIEKLIELNQLKNDAVYIYTPNYGIEEEDAIRELSDFYIVGEKKSISVFIQGQVNYYRLMKK